MTTARPRQGRRRCRVEILPNEESVGQRASLRSLPFWLERNSVSSCAHRDGRGAIGVTSWRLLLRDCVAGNLATPLPCAREHRGPFPGYSSAPQTAERARNAWRRSPNTVLLDVRRYRRELIGKRMVTALEHQIGSSKSKRSVCQNGVPQSKAPGGEEGGWPRTRVLVPRWLR